MTPAYTCSPFTYNSIITVGQLRNESMSVCCDARLDHFIFCCVELAVGNVFVYASMEEEWLLSHKGNLRTQPAFVEFRKISSVKGGRFVKSHEEANDA